MIKDVRTYTNFNGEEVKGEFYFNLTEAELADMHLSTEGGLEQKITAIVGAKNVPELAALFKKIICLSYGKKSPDGTRFDKSPEILAEYVSTQAYSDLYMELARSDEKASKFINGVLDSTKNGIAVL